MLPVTRQQVADKIVALIQADVDAKLRESNGPNRSPRIDSFNHRAGEAMGAPYCASGGWCAIDDACKALGLKNPMKATGWSQAFASESFVPLKYLKPVGDGLALKGFGAVLRDPSDNKHGHYVTVSEDQKQADVPLFHTVEYNTDVAGSREGDGAYAKIRSTLSRSKQNAGKIFVCFVDNPGWIMDHNFPG